LLLVLLYIAFAIQKSQIHLRVYNSKFRQKKLLYFSRETEQGPEENVTVTLKIKLPLCYGHQPLDVNREFSLSQQQMQLAFSAFEIYTVTMTL